jgi:hypothetical protein
LHARLVALGGRGLRIRRLGATRAGEIRLTRFLRNGAVSPEAMLAEAARGVSERCAGRRVLAIQDTTVVRSDGGGSGLYLHVALAVDAESGAILGLTDAVFLKRGQGKKAARRSTPMQAKQSQRWIDGAVRSAQACQGAAKVTHMADREADIFGLFARRPEATELLIRAEHDRALEGGKRLFAAADAQPIAGRAVIELPAGPGRKARKVQLAARFMSASIARPNNGLVEDLPRSLPVTLVDIREETAPGGGQTPLHWRLITTHQVTNAAEAFAVANLYRRRWAIEQLFRTLKTKGFDIEGVLIEDEAPLCNLVMAALIAAVTIQQLVHAREGDDAPGPLRPLTDAFEPEDQPLLKAFSAQLEGKTQRQKNPHPNGSLAYGAWVCARLGGWTGYYGKPGPVVMLQGWLYFQAAKHGAQITPHLRDV